MRDPARETVGWYRQHASRTFVRFYRGAALFLLRRRRRGGCRRHGLGRRTHCRALALRVEGALALKLRNHLLAALLAPLLAICMPSAMVAGICVMTFWPSGER